MLNAYVMHADFVWDSGLKVTRCVPVVDGTIIGMLYITAHTFVM